MTPSSQTSESLENPGRFTHRRPGFDIGTTFDTYAVGDLDCDGLMAMFTLHGDATGNQLTPLPPGVY